MSFTMTGLTMAMTVPVRDFLSATAGDTGRQRYPQTDVEVMAAA
jgi:hypothetical protein